MTWNSDSTQLIPPVECWWMVGSCTRARGILLRFPFLKSSGTIEDIGGRIWKDGS